MLSITAIVFIGLGVAGVFGTSIGLILGFSPIGDDVIHKRVVKQTRLKKGSHQFETWEKLPFPLILNVYVFNITNPDAVVNSGAIPAVKEIGPFVYKQYYTKENIQYSEDNDTLMYRQRLEMKFDAEKSQHREDTLLTVLNLPLQDVLQSKEKDSTADAVNEGITSAFDGNGLFVKVLAKDFLFNGYAFCDTKKMKKSINTFFNAKSLCAAVRNVELTNPTVVQEVNNIKFSFLSHKNNNTDGLFQIFAGMKNISSLGEINNWEGGKHLKAWDGHLCNHIQGTDSTVFAPFNSDNTTFYTYITDICRVVMFKTKKKDKFRGIEGLYAVMERENFRSDGNLSCFCIKKTANLQGALDCLPPGFVDLHNCIHAPVVLSFPHLLWADKQYAKTVEGLSPNENKHTSFILVEPVTGKLLQRRKRLQYNMIVRKMPAYSATQKMRSSVIPILWVDEGFDLSPDLVKDLKKEYLDTLSLIDTVTFVAIGGGTALIVAAIAFFLFPRF